MRLRVVEVIAEGEILVQKSQRDVWTTMRDRGGLYPEILRLVASTAQLLEKRRFDPGVPLCVAEPVIACQVVA